jgi:hypothetical protein
MQSYVFVVACPSTVSHARNQHERNKRQTGRYYTYFDLRGGRCVDVNGVQSVVLAYWLRGYILADVYCEGEIKALGSTYSDAAASRRDNTTSRCHLIGPSVGQIGVLPAATINRFLRL